MIINDYELPGNVHIEERNIAPTQTEFDSEWLSSPNPFISNLIKYGYKKISLLLDLECNTANEIELLKSKIVQELQKAVIKFHDLDFYYTGCIDSFSFEPTSSLPGCYHGDLQIEFLAIAEGVEISENVGTAGQKTIHVNGTLDTPCIIKITPRYNTSQITITGMTEEPFVIRKIHTGQIIEINGRTGTIKEAGMNKFNDTTLVEFPKLHPGYNLINIESGQTCESVIIYKPRYF